MNYLMRNKIDIEKIKNKLFSGEFVAQDFEVTVDGTLMFKTNDIAHFIPIIIRNFKLIDVSTGECEHMCEVAALVNNNGDVELTKSKIATFEQLKVLNFQADIDSKCFCYEQSDIKKLILTFLYFQISKIPEEIMYKVSRLGYINLNGKRAYVAGNNIIAPEGMDNILVDEGLRKYHLNQKRDSITIFDFEYIDQLFDFYPGVSPLLVTATFLGVLKKPFSDAGHPVKFSLYARGEQSSGKTTAVTYCCGYYNRNDDVESNLHNLTATEARLHKVLNDEKDMVTIIDDLRKSDSKAILRKQESLLDDLIRVAANNIGVENMHRQYDVGSFVVFMGEYALKNPSTNNRILLVEFDKKKLNKEKLRKVQNNPGRLEKVIYDFILWILSNYDDVVKKILTYYSGYSNDDEVYMERLQNHGRQLLIAYYLFFDYCIEKSHNLTISKEQMNRLIENTVTNQIENLELGEKDELNYLLEIYEVFHDRSFENSCQIKPMYKKWKHNFYYDTSRNKLYLPNPTLQEWLEGLRVPISTYEAMNFFEAVGLLEMDNSKKRTRTKKLEGRRCYVIDVTRWKNYCKELVETSYQD